MLIAAFITSCGSLSTTMLYPQEISEVIIIENTNKLDLFIRANNWMVETFNDAESVIQFTDKEGGIVTGKYLLHTKILGTQVPREPIFAIIKIQVKDNAAKITIKPDQYVNNYNSLAGGTSYPISQVNSDVNNLVILFKNYMKESIDDF